MKQLCNRKVQDFAVYGEEDKFKNPQLKYMIFHIFT